MITFLTSLLSCLLTASDEGVASLICEVCRTDWKEMIREFFSKKTYDIDSLRECYQLLSHGIGFWFPSLQVWRCQLHLSWQQSLSFYYATFVAQVNMINQALWWVDESEWFTKRFVSIASVQVSIWFWYLRLPERFRICHYMSRCWFFFEQENSKVFNRF